MDKVKLFSVFAVLGEAGDGAEAKYLVAQLQPDILLLDLGKSALAFSRDAQPKPVDIV